MKIEIAKIRFNPDNPRHFITDESIESIARSLKAEGQQEQIKVRALQDGDEPSDGCTGKEKAVYELVEGERRTRGMLKNGATHIEAEILTGSRLDFMFRGICSNQGEPYHWLDRYGNVEKISKAFPDMTQQEIADRLEMQQRSVSLAQRLMPLLSEAARQQIYVRDIKSDDWKTSEKPITALLGLATGAPEDQNRVEQALKVVLDRKMTEKQARKMVSWVQKGNTPESYPTGGKAKEGNPSSQPSPLKRGEGDLAGEGESTETTSPQTAGGKGDLAGNGTYATLLQEMADTGYLKIKKMDKGSVHIIIQDEDRAAVGAYGAAGALRPLERALRSSWTI